MKYYTKEWYELLQAWGLSGDFKKIPDAVYTTADIEKLYKKKLKKEIAFERDSYNQEPFFLTVDDMLTEDNFCPDDWLYIDEITGDVKRPVDINEVRQQLEKDRKRAFEEFENRPPFDPMDTEKIFEEIYRTNIRTCKNNFPEWLLKSVDHRLLALGYLPETAYRKYHSEIREKKKKWEQINRAAEKERTRQCIPDEMMEAMALHDASLLSLKRSGKNIVMIVRKDGMWLDEPTPYRKLIFKKAEILEQEKGLRVRKYLQEGFYSSNCSFLYSEIYNSGGGYEFHMMFATSKDLSYLTIACNDISVCDGISIK